MLVLCDAAEGREHPEQFPVRLVVTEGPRPIRETTTAAALVRKGLAERDYAGRFYATPEGYWLGDGLRILDRLGRIPARRTA